jgi:hypothetical protein
MLLTSYVKKLFFNKILDFKIEKNIKIKKI